MLSSNAVLPLHQDQKDKIYGYKKDRHNAVHIGCIASGRIACLRQGSAWAATIRTSRHVRQEAMDTDGIVRLSKIEIYPQYLEAYKKYATEVGEISLRTEPGVLTMYAVSEKENPCRITIIETYASREAYRKHIASTHFRKYKQGTLHMVKSLELTDQTPLNPSNRICNFME